MSDQKTILITGCSSGIGAALAQEFHRRGHWVYATARQLESLRELKPQGLRTLALDVNDGASISAALAVVQSEAGRIDILINNAGYGQFGAVMDADISDLRNQFETNVFAPVVLSRAALPLLRKSAAGCIANMGSISGLVTTPFAGVYCASKAALHALSDAMRMELVPLGLHVQAIPARLRDHRTVQIRAPDRGAGGVPAFEHTGVGVPEPIVAADLDERVGSPRRGGELRG